MSIEVSHISEIPGLLVFTLDKNSDERGYFQEKFQKEKLNALGLPLDFNPVQHNISYNIKKGTTRGLHAEPWDKYISVIKGKVFCAFLDLRPRTSFGNIFTITLDESKAVFLPQGIANSYQTLEPDVYYSYLVNAHWSPEVKYIAVNMADPSLKIKWPISLNQAIISDKDRNNPFFKDLKFEK